MDKNQCIARLAADGDDRLLLARVWDKYEQTRHRDIPAATEFLSPRQQILAQRLLAAMGVTEGFVLDGGYDGAERKKLCFLPDWAQQPEQALCFLRAEAPPGGGSLTHRDVLGSLMALGITRERLGDILVGESSADVVLSPALGEFLLLNWVSAGRVRLSVREIPREQLRIPEVKVRQIRDTVSSLRLDAVVATAFSVSRGRAAELIAGGRVSLDHFPCEKPDKPVGEGSVISCRGLGRARVSEVGGLSKKGRIAIVVERYI